MSIDELEASAEPCRCTPVTTVGYRGIWQPLKSMIRAYCVGGTPWVHPLVVTVLRVPSGTCPPLQVSVVHWV
jgi:hypothetical protein